MAIRSCAMLLLCCVMLLCLTCVQPMEDIRDNVHIDRVSEYNRRFSLWPSMHNAAKRFLRNRRDVQEQKDAAKLGDQIVPSEGGDLKTKLQVPAATSPVVVVSSESNKTKPLEKNNTELKPDKPVIGPEGGNITEAVASINASTTPSTTNGTVTAKIASDPEKPPTKDIDLNNPGVLKRGFIVFGGFALLAVAYFVFYKRKGKPNNSSNNHSGTNDTNQFRYGVLQSEDRRDNMELSRVPLTMESDDDEEEDLEIFDLGQKKKSLSYVNLPLNDEDVVLSPSDDKNEGENLLLDIETANSDTLINWSSNSNNKSIL